MVLGRKTVFEQVRESHSAVLKYGQHQVKSYYFCPKIDVQLRKIGVISKKRWCWAEKLFLNKSGRATLPYWNLAKTKWNVFTFALKINVQLRKLGVITKKKVVLGRKTVFEQVWESNSALLKSGQHHKKSYYFCFKNQCSVEKTNSHYK